MSSFSGLVMALSVMDVMNHGRLKSQLGDAAPKAGCHTLRLHFQGQLPFSPEASPLCFFPCDGLVARSLCSQGCFRSQNLG